MSHEARTQILTGGAKSLLIINGGGIVALLGFLTRLLPFESDNNRAYASLVLFAIASFTIGLVVAAANYYFRYWASSYYDNGPKEKHPRAHRLEKASVVVSFAFFILGAFVLVIGMYYLINYAA